MNSEHEQFLLSLLTPEQLAVVEAKKTTKKSIQEILDKIAQEFTETKTTSMWSLGKSLKKEISDDVEIFALQNKNNECSIWTEESFLKTVPANFPKKFPNWKKSFQPVKVSRRPNMYFIQEDNEVCSGNGDYDFIKHYQVEADYQRKYGPRDD